MTVLDWRARSVHWRDLRHWEGPLACAYCKRPTQLLDDDGRPAHKVCAEAALERGDR